MAPTWLHLDTQRAPPFRCPTSSPRRQAGRRHLHRRRRPAPLCRGAAVRRGAAGARCGAGVRAPRPAGRCGGHPAAARGCARARAAWYARCFAGALLVGHTALRARCCAGAPLCARAACCVRSCPPSPAASPPPRRAAALPAVADVPAAAEACGAHFRAGRHLRRPVQPCARPPTPPHPSPRPPRPGAAPLSAAKRRAHFRAAAARRLAYDPGHVYTFHIYDSAIDFQRFQLAALPIDGVKVSVPALCLP